MSRRTAEMMAVTDRYISDRCPRDSVVSGSGRQLEGVVVGRRGNVVQVVHKVGHMIRLVLAQQVRGYGICNIRIPFGLEFRPFLSDASLSGWAIGIGIVAFDPQPAGLEYIQMAI